jgi:subtilisin family serine protease
MPKTPLLIPTRTFRNKTYSMKNFLLVLLLFLSTFSFAQNKYLVIFKDKADSPYSIQKPGEFLSVKAIERRQKQGISITQHDVPVNPTYLKVIKNLGITIEYSSKWLNAALVNTSKAKLAEVLKLSFVKGLEGNFENGLENPKTRNKSEASGNKSTENIPLVDPGSSFNQLSMLGADVMHKKGFTGKGVLIGLLDSGFSNADKLDVFNDLFEEKRVLETFNFVDKGPSVYNAHSHGTSVLSCIAASLDGQMLGTAPEATFVLYVTENVNYETKMEEANWLFAAERADSIGVDIVGSSLGYSDFQGSEQDYTYANLDGNTALVTRAADWLASKGVLVVVSAGNEGNKAWKYITAPADGDSVIAVGAVDANQKYVSFSSIGPSSDGRIKPEIAAKGAGTTVATPSNFVGTSNGTSFAAPLITGLVAGLRQAFPDFMAMEIREILLKSGSQANQPDDILGYGVPNFERAYEMATLQQLIKSTDKNVLVFPNPTETNGKIKVLVTKEELGSEFNVSITNIKGTIIYSENFKRNFFELNIVQKELATGLYILKIWNDKFSETERILIE